VVRIAREFGKQSYIGAFASTRDLPTPAIASFARRPSETLSALGHRFQATHSWTRQDLNLPQLCQQFNPPSQIGGRPQPLLPTGQQSYAMSRTPDAVFIF